MKRLLLMAMIIAAGACPAQSEDLYHVTVASHSDAERLRSLDVQPVMVVSDGYLVLADERASARLDASGLEIQLLATEVTIDNLGIDRAKQRKTSDKREILFSDGNLRVCRLEAGMTEKAAREEQLMPLRPGRIAIAYRPPMVLNPAATMAGINFDSLITLINQDSIASYTRQLEAFGPRVAGTDACRASGLWLAAQFTSFGYDSVTVDSFVIGTQSYAGHVDTLWGCNIIACRIGAVHPNRQIVVGAHYDSEVGSPGADDNASGTASVLELARVFRQMETEMTFVFAAFDAEELGLVGSHRYAAAAAARGDSIIVMHNMDMIGHYTNDQYAALYFGPQAAYAALWSRMAYTLDDLHISAPLFGMSGGSDHYEFVQYGYDVVYAQEYDFSDRYHTPNDSTTYLNFEYMTRMIKTSLATLITVDVSLPPVSNTSARDVGDGHSIELSWLPADPAEVAEYRIYYTTYQGYWRDSLVVNKDSTRYRFSGLYEGTDYYFYVVWFDHDGRSSISMEEVTASSKFRPRQPQQLLALPARHAIRFSWQPANMELDFDHYIVSRDQVMLPDPVHDTVFLDSDPSLGTATHEYMVWAVDRDGNMSDTTSIVPVSSRAASLTEGRILAVNRSHRGSGPMVNETITGEFLRQALEGCTFDYYSDTAYSMTLSIGLMDMIDYGMLIIGGESGRTDDIGLSPAYGGMLNDLSHYLTVGGKVIIFGRWGDLRAPTMPAADTSLYLPDSAGYPYVNFFNMPGRIRSLTMIDTTGGTTLYSDFVGAHSVMPAYPDLVWDSLATLSHCNHSGARYVGVSGIPCAGFPILGPAPVDILYTYNSSNDSTLTENQPLAWRSLGGSQEYVYFHLPLSFMQRPAAVAALRRAVNDLGISVAVDDRPGPTPLPKEFALLQNHPNPFNPTTTIEFRNPMARPVMATVTIYNILGQEVRRVFDGPALSGLNRVQWDGRDADGRGVASGIYLYRLKAESATLTRKMVLLK